MSLLFAENPNVASPFLFIPLTLLSFYLFASVASWKFTRQIFQKDFSASERGKAPWDLLIAFAFLIVFAIISPSVCARITPFVQDKIPVLNITTNESQNERDLATNVDSPTVDETNKKRDLSTQHPVARMLIRSVGTRSFPIVLAVFVFTVVVVAPITEELIVRVVIQSACEKAFFDKRPLEQDNDVRSSKSFLRIAAVVLPSAILFALMHFSRPEDPAAPIPVDELFSTTIATAASNVLTTILVLTFLVKICGAKRGDLGFNRSSDGNSIAAIDFLKDFFRGTFLFVYFAPCVYALHIAAQTILTNVVVDPLPIFLFALFSGVVYYRTHSYPAVVGIHVGLNFTSFLCLCMSLGAQ